MVNTNALKAAMARKGLTQNDVAKRISISTQSFSAKILNKTEFKIDEVYKLRTLLALSGKETMEIFFAKKLD